MKVVGIGNAWGRDDAVGLVVARKLREQLPPAVAVVELEGEPVGLLEAFDGEDDVWLVDAVSSGADPGTVHRRDATDGELPAELFRGSTHLLGVAEGIELARALGRLPRRVVVFGVEGASFAAGEGLSPAVEEAVARVVAAIREEVERCTSGR